MSDKKSSYVFDSHALIAFLEDEAGASRVKTILTQAERNQADIFLSIVNFGEIVYITEREKGLVAAQSVIAALDELPLTIIEADRKLTLAASHLKAKYSVSYADAFAIALAQTQDAKLVTGDPEIRVVEGIVAVEWLSSK